MSTLRVTNGIESDFSPNYSGSSGAQVPFAIDPDGNTKTRTVTDEGGYRINFSGTSLAKSIGTATFTNGSGIVAWTLDVSYDLSVGDYVFRDADGVAFALQVDSFTDTEITLSAPYAGTTGTSVSSRQICKTIVGAGTSVTVTNGTCVLASGTTSGSVVKFERKVDYLPMAKQAGISYSQRIANQTVNVGFYEDVDTPRFFAWLLFDGTTNTTLKCQTARNATGAPSASETEETIITVPNGKNTAVSLRYRIELFSDRCLFYIEGILVATHVKSLPAPHDVMVSSIRMNNTGVPATSGTLTIDYDVCRNFNSLDVYPASDTSPFAAQQIPLAPFNYNVAGVIAINTDLLIIDCSQIRALSVQCNAMGTTGVVTAYLTNDLATLGVTTPVITVGGVSSASFNAAGAWQINSRNFRYLRLRLTTATTAGTTTLFCNGSQMDSDPSIATQPISGTVTANIGTGAIAAGTNLIGDVGVQVRATAGGMALTSRIISVAATTNATSAKATAGRVYKVRGYNIAAAVRYLKIYNKASAPTVGTDVPVLTLALPASQVFDIDFGTIGYYFATGIAYALTTGSADADTGALVAGDVLGLNLIYA